MSSSTEINMENYFESLSQNDKLAYTNHIRLESGKTLPYSLRNDWIKDVDASPEVFMGRCDTSPQSTDS